MPKLKNSKNNSARNHNTVWISFAILFVGFFVTFIVSNYVSQEDESKYQKEFDLVCNEVMSKINSRINLQAQFLLSGSSLFEASQFVTRNEWKLFNKFSSIDKNYTGVQGFGFSLIVKKAQLKNHISVVRKEGFPKYKIFPEGVRDIYTTII
jgi:CHASE1-domain containing sensor protein